MREWRVVRAGQQQEIDERAYASGIESDSLMEQAGAGAAAWMLDHGALGRTVVVAGPGGNGGDALVVARHLAEAGVQVVTLVAAPAEALSPATQRMLHRLRESQTAPLVREYQPETHAAAIHGANTIIDGLFGAGLNRPLGDCHIELASLINAAVGRVISLDVPSGLSADHGAPLGAAVRADTTLVMEFMKPAHLLYPAAESCGSLAVIPVGYPAPVLESARPLARVLAACGVNHRLPRRRPDGHKGTFGRVVVVAGSIGMTGAAILCCRGALRAGAGLVSLACPASLNMVFEVTLPETVTLPYPDEDGRLSLDAVEPVLAALDRADVLVIGPGLSREPKSVHAVSEILRRSSLPVVVDADALFAISSFPDLLGSLVGRAVLTPHPGEVGQLLDRRADEVDAERIDLARTYAIDQGVTLLLKGRPTVIARPNADLYLNPTGNTGLATGGSGDVLAGLIAGFAAGGAALSDAALVASYLHGAAAEQHSRDRAERSLTPSDLLDRLPIVLKEIET